MSEPLTSHEIEDVLSSIRRLVSEDLRPARAAMAAARGDGAVGAGTAEVDKLLLTPALRVVPPEPAPAPAEVPVAAEAVMETVFVDAVADLLPEDPGSDPDDVPPAAGFETADAFALSEDAFSHERVAFPASHEVYDDADVDESAPPLPPRPELIAGEEDVLWAAAGEAGDGPADVIAPPNSHGHWTAQDVPGVDWAEDETGWAEPEPLSFVPHPRKPDLTSDPLARAWADRAEAAVRAELDDAVAAHVAEATSPQAAAQPSPDAAVAGPGLFDSPDASFDEEMLREVVRDIIREELAGTLGERITRNVRKLVRVEINRAMTAREFE
ncbi:hypothetical protein MASR1M32_23640 [Rhodobacter sp.]